MEKYYDLREYFYKKSTWDIKKQWTNECVWETPEYDHPTQSAGKCLVVGEENRFGERRARIIVKPDKGWDPKDTESYHAALIWVNEPRPNIPSKFKIHSVK
jgi:hypothetical protein